MYRADGPEEMRPVGEVEFVQGLAAASASGLYGPGRAAAAIVGQPEPGRTGGTGAGRVAGGQPNRFRGIRHSVTWDPHPEVDNTAAHRMERQLASDQFRTGARCWPGGCPSRGGSTSRSYPSWRILQSRPRPDHHPEPHRRPDAGGPYANRDDEVLATWRSGIAAVAKCPNVYMKLGGLGMPRTGFDWHTRSKPVGSEELAASMAPG